MKLRFWRRPEAELRFDELGLGVSDDEIAATFAPFVRDRYDRDGQEWSAIVDDRRARARRKLLDHPDAESQKWDTERSLRSYAKTWGVDFETWLDTAGAVGPCEWRREGMMARVMGLKRVHQLMLMRVFERVQPRTVLEVGSGNGVNLFVLSARFPESSFAGIELTEAGVAAATAVIAKPELPAALQAFSPEPLVDPTAHTRLDVRQGNARTLPFPDGSFDLVYSVLALELMDQIRGEVLPEMRRVSRGHVAMVEPFFEWHASGHRRDLIAAKGYFAQPIEGLDAFGLEPIVATADMPHKLDYQPGLVVARALN
jgi:SAM-dependent methyltransferase